MAIRKTMTGLVDDFGFAIFEYQFSLTTPLLLDMGVVYFLSIANDFGGNDIWLWSTFGSGASASRATDADAWAAFARDMAFVLDGEVIDPNVIPLPGGALLFLTGAGAIGARRLRRR